MGTDLAVVDAARVSFAKRSQWEFLPGDEAGRNIGVDLSAQDKRLMKFLATGMEAKERKQIEREIFHGTYDQKRAREIMRRLQDCQIHFAPFAHIVARFHVKAPLCAARQLWKSHIGLANQDENIGWSEVSRRYVDEDPEFYIPKKWRKRAQSKKQGSSDEPVTHFMLTPAGITPCFTVKPYVAARWAARSALAFYRMALNSGVAPEQARMFLPQNMMTEWIWTGSILAFSRICKLRLDSHAQEESREVARQIDEQLTKVFPNAWGALMGKEEKEE